MRKAASVFSCFFLIFLEKSILYPNQALPPPVYTNISKLQAAAQRGVGGAPKDPTIAATAMGGDTPRSETPPLLHSHYDNHQSGEMRFFFFVKIGPLSM